MPILARLSNGASYFVNVGLRPGWLVPRGFCSCTSLETACFATSIDIEFTEAAAVFSGFLPGDVRLTAKLRLGLCVAILPPRGVGFGGDVNGTRAPGVA